MSINTAKVTSKEERIYIRLNPENKKLLTEAAGYTNETTSSFVRRTAIENARKIVNENSVLKLSPRDSLAFIKALDNPPPPNENLRKAAMNYLKYVTYDS